VITYTEAVSGEATIMIAEDDGTLLVMGGRWKECPRPEKPCPRSGREPMPEMYNKDHPKCQYCSYSGRMHLDSQEQAIRIAEIFAEIYGSNGRGHARRSLQTLL
jgi:hypothetical protein